jgi:hypothetical protein
MTALALVGSTAAQAQVYVAEPAPVVVAPSAPVVVAPPYARDGRAARTRGRRAALCA